MNNFIFSYNGNKYLEAKKYFKDFDFTKYDIIAEPFCGIFGFSRFAYERGFRGKILLNDYSKKLIDELIALKGDIVKYCNDKKNIVSNFATDSQMSKENKDEGVKLIYRKASLRLLNKETGNKKIFNFLKKKEEYKKMFDIITFSNLENNEFLQTIPRGKRTLVFFDPPYIDTCLQQYKFMVNPNYKDCYDGTYIYLDILNYFRKNETKSIMILNKVCIIHESFKDFYKNDYMRVYQNTGKKKGHHVIYETE